MKALGKLTAGKGITMYEAPIPKIDAHEVLIQVSRTAICGTDMHIYHWDSWAEQNIPIPLTTGHEFSGVIVERGSLVKEFDVGQRVSAEGHITCGLCRACRTGKAHVCSKTQGIGVQKAGAFAEYVAIPQSNLIALPDDISDDLGAILDPLGNATHTALSFDLNGEDVLITGAGPIGCMAVVIAKHCGARNIVITDVNQHRLQMAKDLGATDALNICETSILSVMEKLGMTEGFDVCLEMSGAPPALEQIIQFAIPSGKVALLGILPNDAFPLDWNQVIFKGLTIQGIYGRRMFDTWYKMIFMLQAGMSQKIASVITHRFDADDYEKAFETMEEGKCGKIIMNWK